MILLKIDYILVVNVPLASQLRQHKVVHLVVFIKSQNPCWHLYAKTR